MNIDGVYTRVVLVVFYRVWSLVQGDVAQVELLLKQGFNPNVQDYAGWTPLVSDSICLRTVFMSLLSNIFMICIYINIHGVSQ